MTTGEAVVDGASVRKYRTWVLSLMQSVPLFNRAAPEITAYEEAAAPSVETAAPAKALAEPGSHVAAAIANKRSAPSFSGNVKVKAADRKESPPARAPLSSDSGKRSKTVASEGRHAAPSPDSRAAPLAEIVNAETLLYNKLRYDADAGNNLKKTAVAKDTRRSKDRLPKDPKQALAVVEKRRMELEERRKNDPEGAKSVEESLKWSAAIRRAQGVTIKDDVRLLKKAAARRDARKAVSEREWKERAKDISKQTAEKQKKRQANIQARIDAKREKNLGSSKKKTGKKDKKGKSKGKGKK